MVISHSLGFPRIGPKRELKRALEAYWSGKTDLPTMIRAAKAVRDDGWASQAGAGVDYIPVGDFSLYDHVLDMSLMLGNIPDRFKTTDSLVDMLFLMGRGRSVKGKATAAGEMTKWFNTNYHCIVPEMNKARKFNVDATRLVEQIKDAQKAGYQPKPVLVGPLTYLWVSKMEQDSSKAHRLDFVSEIAQGYKQLLAQVEATGVEWVQIDEPVLVLDLDDEWLAALKQIYDIIGKSAKAKRLLVTYFESVAHNLPAVLQMPIDGIHIDLVAAPAQLNEVVQAVKDTALVLSVGVINGRNVWKTDLENAFAMLQPVHSALGARMWLAPSCSLMFSPLDLDAETKLDDELKSWLAFAYQKLDELALLKKAFTADVSSELAAYSAPVKARRSSKRINNPAVAERVTAIKETMRQRASAYSERATKQADVLSLPLYPTTTVGSFPQTSEIRKTRLDYKRGEIPFQQYEQKMRAQIEFAVERQEAYKLDVFVHGEAERNDMVEYFGEQLDGYATTQMGWVQSYGSRCVKPPIIYGDVSRPKPMTLQWIQYAQTLTDKPVKGMLTGPVTMLAWAFRRDDTSFENTCAQVALALRDEVADLERAGIGIIQIDEPAFREALPLRASKYADYYENAVGCFKLCTAGVKDETQIQSHMCYSDFNEAIEHIAAMDVDVLLIEASRSGLKIFEAFKEFQYPNSIGIGVFDIHSPNVPSVESMVSLIKGTATLFDKKQLWVTPDCGLKTRTWEQVDQSLDNMVEATIATRNGG